MKFYVSVREHCSALPLIVTQATSASLIARCDSQSELSMPNDTSSTGPHHYRIDCACSFARVMLRPREVLSSAGVQPALRRGYCSKGLL